MSFTVNGFQSGFESEFFYRTEMDLNQTASLWHHFLNEQVIGYEARCILWILNSKKEAFLQTKCWGELRQAICDTDLAEAVSLMSCLWTVAQANCIWLHQMMMN